MIKCAIITLSDRASSGAYTDESSQIVQHYLEKTVLAADQKASFQFNLIPDEALLLHNLILNYTDNQTVDVVFTTGGTGIGSRDITPETIAPLLTKTLPGVMELVRVKYGLLNPKAALSRGVAGIRHNTLIFTLPGSPKAVTEYCEVVMPLLIHAIEMVRNNNTSHNQPKTV